MKMTTMITMIAMTNLPQYASTSAFGYEDEDQSVTFVKMYSIHYNHYTLGAILFYVLYIYDTILCAIRYKLYYILYTMCYTILLN